MKYHFKSFFYRITQQVALPSESRLGGELHFLSRRNFRIRRKLVHCHSIYSRIFPGYPRHLINKAFDYKVSSHHVEIYIVSVTHVTKCVPTNFARVLLGHYHFMIVHGDSLQIFL
jgi:hypothetical protein